MRNLKPRAVEAGTRYGRLTATGNAKFEPFFSKYKGKMKRATWWEFECDCAPGVTFWKQASSIKTGAVISCGNGCWRFKPTAAQNTIYAGYRGDAERRDLSFELTFDEACKLFDSLCHYCGSEPANVRKVKSYTIVFNGIDRLNSDLGYTTTNCVSCCKRCNYAKHIMTTSDFLGHVAKIYAHSIAQS